MTGPNGLQVLALVVMFAVTAWACTRHGRDFLNHQPTDWTGGDQP